MNRLTSPKLVVYPIFIAFFLLLALSTQQLTAAEDHRVSADPNWVPGSPLDTRQLKSGWQSVNTFESYAGSIDGQGGWTSNNATVVTDPVNSSNRVMALGEDNKFARKSFPDNGIGGVGIPQGNIGTIFFRFYREGQINAFGGASDNFSPTELSEYEVQLGADYNAPVSDFLVRDRTTFRTGGTFSEGAWHCVWLVVNNDFDTYQAYVQGGTYSNRTLLNLDGVINFEFRNGTGSNDLQQFLARSGPLHNGTAYYDDINIDFGNVNTSFPSGVGPCAGSGGGSNTPDIGWKSVNTFESYSGAIDGQGAWTSNSATVVTDPTNGSNRVLSLSESDRFARKFFPDNGAGGFGIPNGRTGTIFFRFYRSGPINAFGGASDNNFPTEFDEYEVQIGANSNDPVSDIVIRDGNTSDSGGVLRDQAWHCIWLVVDNNADQYDVYVEGGEYSTRTKISFSGDDQFGFRNGSASNDIQQFLIRSGSNHNGTAYYDDINIDAGQVNLAKPNSIGPCDGNSTEPPVSGWQSINTFESYFGNMNGQGGWVTNGATAIVDPQDNSNRVLEVAQEGIYAYKPLAPGGIFEESTGTLFFRMYRDGAVNAYAGASDTVSPTEFSDFEVQVGAYATDLVSEFSIRDGSSFRTAGPFDNQVWYCVWIEAYHTFDQYRVYAQGGAYANRTVLNPDSVSLFDFRNGSTSDPLSDFLVRSGNDMSGSVLIDDIYIDSSQANSSLPGGVCEENTVPDTPTPDTTTPDPDTTTPEPIATPVIGWQTVNTFETSSGNINGIEGWVSNGGVAVVDPTGLGNTALRLSRGDQYAYSALPDNGIGSIGVPNGASGTLFFRFYRSGQVIGYVGSSDKSQPTLSTDFQTQFGAYVDPRVSEISIRDGNVFRTGENIQDEAWHCVWIVMDNAFDNYRVFVKGGDFESRTRMNLSGVRNFDFRNGSTANALTTFIVQTENGTTGDLYIDDIFFDAGQENTGQPGGGCEGVAQPTTPTVTPTPTNTPTPAGPSIFRVLLPYINTEPDPEATSTPTPTPVPPPCVYAEVEPNDLTEQARLNGLLPVCDTVIINGRMTSATDRYDIYRIDPSESIPLNFYLTNIPNGVNYDLFLADENQDIIERSDLGGMVDEFITHTVTAGETYFIAVFNEREVGSEDRYTLEITIDR